MTMDVTVPGIEAFLEQYVGIRPQVVGNSWERALRIRMNHLNMISYDQYYDRLLNSKSECQALIELIVVTETSFFRDRAAIEYLVQSIRQTDNRTHPAPWRILSAGCSSGEEPYSIAMALLDSGISPTRFSIIACDISQTVLDKAEKGVYGKNAFRGGSRKFQEKYFDRLEEGQYLLRANVRRLVRFYLANISDPWFLMGGQPFDAIFFRNVLVYLGKEAQTRALLHCLKLLEPGGLLFVGPTEIEMARARGFIPILAPNACAFKSPESPLITLEPLLRPVKYRKAVIQVPPISEEMVREQMLEEAQSLANNGEVDAALMTCHRYISLYGGGPEVFFLMGILEVSARCDERAERYFKKALYLDPNHYEALVNLALIAERSGEREEAQRLWKRARRIHGGKG